jgi:N-acetylmuramoyl-L-alanine amidase
VFVTLSDRASIANDWGADFFVSIHCNSNGESAVGIETLYKSDAGKRLAAAVQQAMLQATGDRDRGLKYRSDLYVLNATVMPAILAEIGFISHRATEEKLATTDYRWTIAEAVFEGIVQHLGWNTDSSRK